MTLTRLSVTRSVDWIKNLLMRGIDDMKALARSTLKEAEKVYGANDDMTVVTVRVEERV